MEGCVSSDDHGCSMRSLMAEWASGEGKLGVAWFGLKVDFFMSECSWRANVRIGRTGTVRTGRTGTMRTGRTKIEKTVRTWIGRIDRTRTVKTVRTRVGKIDQMHLHIVRLWRLDRYVCNARRCGGR